MSLRQPGNTTDRNHACKPVKHSGRLTTWKDDRGFGFITPDQGGKDVFLHISAVRGASCRPKVGDIILYEQSIEPGKKVRAENAVIKGSAPAPRSRSQQPTHRQRNRAKKESPPNVTVGIGSAVITVGLVILAAVVAMERSPSRSPSVVTAVIKPGCDIKGNISQTSGKKWYHLPGMEDYEDTVIDPSYGERWFCSEAEAKANGWRKAPK